MYKKRHLLSISSSDEEESKPISNHTPSLEDLPRLVLEKIFTHFNKKTLNRLRLTSKSLRALVDSSSVWRRMLIPSHSMREFNTDMWKLINQRQFRGVLLEGYNTFPQLVWDLINFLIKCPPIKHLRVVGNSTLELQQAMLFISLLRRGEQGEFPINIPKHHKKLLEQPKKVIQIFANLEVFELASVCTEDQMYFMLREISAFQNLQTLYFDVTMLRHCEPGTPKALAPMLYRMPKLKRLVIKGDILIFGGTDRLNDEGQYIDEPPDYSQAFLFPENPPPEMSSLRLPPLQRELRLESLDILPHSACKLTTNVSALQCLGPRLKSLRLRFLCKCQAEDQERHVIEGLQNIKLYLPHLTKLAVGFQECDKRSLRRWITKLPDELSSLQIWTHPNTSVINILTKVPGLPSLKQLCINRGCPLSKGDLNHLVTGCHHLIKLFCWLTNDVTPEIVKILLNLKSLRIVELQQNPPIEMYGLSGSKNSHKMPERKDLTMGLKEASSCRIMHDIWREVEPGRSSSASKHRDGTALLDLPF